MSTDMTLFNKPRSAAALALLQGIEDITDKIAGSGGNRRISIEGNVFREIVGGKEVRVSEERALNVVIVNIADISRTYYEGKYVKGVKAKPKCWSANSQTPDPLVPVENRQAKFCKDCPQNIKGSGDGEGRACRYAQRAAVILANEDGLDNNVYQISFPATSVFGDVDGQKMPLQAYGRYLKAHNTHVITVVTEMRFDPSGQMKLVFKPVRPLTDSEIEQVVALRDHPDTIKAITMTVSEMDADEKPKALAAPVEEPVAKPKKAAPVEEVAAEEVTEPKKVVKKTAAAAPAPEKDDLSDIVGEWDD